MHFYTTVVLVIKIRKRERILASKLTQQQQDRKQQQQNAVSVKTELDNGNTWYIPMQDNNIKIL